MTKSNLSDEDAEWLKEHKEKIEDLKTWLSLLGVLVVGFTLGFISVPLFEANFLFTAIGGIIFFVFIGVFIFSALGDVDAGFTLLAILTLAGLVGLFLGCAFLPPSSVSTHQQNVSMKVFYPNHPNITVIQSCGSIKTSALGYLNGKAIKPESSTQCNLPLNVASRNSNPYNCTITGKNITCVSTEYGVNETWEGTILNTSYR